MIRYKKLLVGAAATAVLAASVIPASSAAEPPTGEIHPAARAEVSIPISLIFGDVEIGQPLVRVAETGQLLAFIGPDIIEMLRPLVVPSMIERLESSRTAEGLLPLARLADVGITAEYSASELALRILIPFELRQPAALSIATRQPPDEHMPIRPAANVSAYVNLRVADDFLLRGNPGEDKGRQPAIIDFDGAARMLGATFEWTATYREKSANPWHRGNLRLVKDFPSSRNRLTIGDLNYNTAGFQEFQQAGGISFARNFNLQPYRISTSMAERAFTLTRRSEVDVLVNGRRVRTVILEPGRYNLRDLPLATGTNDITMRITDEVGRVETIRFPFVFDTNLLARGEQDFSYTLGVHSRDTLGGKNYDRGEPVLSAFHSVGVSENLTLGANLQAMKHHGVFGAEARLGTPFGVFRGDVALSQSDYAPTGMAARLQYRFTEPSTPESLNRNLLASLIWRSASFAPLGITEPSNPIAFDIGAAYGQKLPYDWFGSTGVSMQLNRDGDPETRAVDFSVGRQIGHSIHFDILGRLEDRRNLGTETSVLLTLSWVPFRSRHRVTVQQDLPDRSTYVDWNYTPAEVLEGIQSNISAEWSPEEGRKRIRADLSYVDYRFEAQVRHCERFCTKTLPARRNTGIRFGTALVFADGHIALSRPISDSFAMVVRHPMLKGREVHVNSVNGRPQARADSLGPAVLPRLPSYFVQRVTLDVPDLPQGYDLGDQLFNVQPDYRSGTVIPIGTGATALVEGTLVDDSGRPVALQFGTIISRDMPAREPKGFFTDAEGRFSLSGLPPGHYELRLEAASEAFVEFDVPMGVSGTYAAGTIVFPMEGNR